MGYKHSNYAVEFSEFPEGHLFISTMIKFEGCAALQESIILRPQDITAMKEFVAKMESKSASPEER